MTFKIFHNIILIALLAFVFNFSCISKKNINDHAPETNETNPKLIFLNYSISKNENGEKKVEFINKVITEGRLKTSEKTQKKGAIGDLKCSQLDKYSTEIQYIIKENPFVKIVEYVNDSLIFEKKKIELSKAPLSIRMPLSSQAKFLVISEIVDSLQTTRPLIITKLD